MSHIVGIGIDTIEIQRVIKACDKSSFIKKYFTEDEQKIINKRIRSSATNFAGKEAVSKAFGTGFSKLKLTDIEILRDELGAPYVNLHGNARSLAATLNISKIHISLTDTDNIAMAYVIAEGDD